MPNERAWSYKTIFDCWGGPKSEKPIQRHETFLAYPKSAPLPIRFYFSKNEYHLALRLLNKLSKPGNGVLHYWTEGAEERLAYTVPEKPSKKREKGHE